jgi:glycosyltransferase involved in cell wall biosynthesis
MRICIVSQNPKFFGGGSVSTNTLAAALEKIGYEISFVEHPKEIDKPDVVLHTNIKYLVRTERICEKKKLPLVITVNSFISCCNGTHITNKDSKYGVPCENCSLLGTINCSLRNRANDWRGIKTRLIDCLTPLPRYILRNLRIRALNKAYKLICISTTDRKMLEIAGVKDDKMEVIPQPVDASFLDDKNIHLFNEKTCLFTGGGSWIKGAHLAAEAVSKLDNVKLVFVGGVQKKMKEVIRGFLGDRAIFIGVVPAEEMKKYYYSAHVILFPSIWFEGYARSFSEAMMCGKPVVAFNNGRGATDYLIHEYNALVSDFNIDAYAEQTQRLFDDDALYKRISKNAQEYAKKNFLADVVAKKYEKVFEEVLNE